MDDSGKILHIEDNYNDVELILPALSAGRQAAEVLSVVRLTSSREERDILRSYDLGTNAYGVKPMSFRDFVETVKEIGHFWGVSIIHRASRGAILRGLARY